VRPAPATASTLRRFTSPWSSPVYLYHLPTGRRQRTKEPTRGTVYGRSWDW
jgi:hypothetical protein